MKFACIVLAVVASQALLVPFSECRPIVELGGIRETFSELEDAFSEGLRLEGQPVEPNTLVDKPQGDKTDPDRKDS